MSQRTEKLRKSVYNQEVNAMAQERKCAGKCLQTPLGVNIAVRMTAEPDWAAIHRGMNAKQRTAFNAFHDRLSILVEEAGHNLSFGSPGHGLEEYPAGSELARASKAVRDLEALICTIPWMFK